MRTVMKWMVAGAALLALTACGSTKAKRLETSLMPPMTDGPQPKVYERTVLSQTYHIDKKYPSMKGPSSMQKVALLDGAEPELLWIVGYEAIVMDPEGEKQVSQEFMCHSNLDFNAREYWEAFKSDASMSGRLFTLSQGQQDIDFPKGFGIPVMSTQKLDLVTQVLNLNLDDPENLNVRHKVTIEFVRDRDVTHEMRPLFQAAVQGFKSLEGKPANYGYSDEKKDDGAEHAHEHAGCSVGLPAVKDDFDEDQFGQKFTGHWVVKPGREENRSIVTKFLQLQFDTTIHYIAVHLHPFAESLELIDKTAGKTVFKAKTRQREGAIGLEHIDYFSSPEGLPLYADHEYELVSVYNNTTDEDHDSMAVMYLYVHDRHWNAPTPETIAALKKKAEEVEGADTTAQNPPAKM
ncbi:MAG: hypothetical protein AAF928_17350 [Myxococcota bacterium]